MYFVILTAALSLHLHGVTDIETSAQAAGALGPLAGKFAQTLFALGIIGAGLLASPP
jgi:Mn2+/Fe2+ NRAMP family transporter